MWTPRLSELAAAHRVVFASARIAGLFGALSISAPPVPAAADDFVLAGLSPAQRAEYAIAAQSFRDHCFAAAYGRFAHLADAGHVPSAQLALVMVRHGPALFDGAWSATPKQIGTWNALVINSARRRFEPFDDSPGD